MHAYHRMEADQTDSIAVCASREEWSDVIEQLLQFRGADGSASDLIHWLINQGVYE